MPNVTPPPTRLISWQQVCLEADPLFWPKKNRPLNYQFSNGRQFYCTVPAYLPITDYLTDENGMPITDENGQLIPVPN